MKEMQYFALIVEIKFSNIKKTYLILFLLIFITQIIIIIDLNRPIKNQFLTKQSILVIDFYQKNISNKIFFIHCRYKISCSKYSKKMIKEKGILKGIFFSIKRISRCL
jgi:hypothetical protein